VPPTRGAKVLSFITVAIPKENIMGFLIAVLVVVILVIVIMRLT